MFLRSRFKPPKNVVWLPTAEQSRLVDLDDDQRFNMGR